MPIHPTERSKQFVENLNLVMKETGMSRAALTRALTERDDKQWHVRSVCRLLNNDRNIKVDEWFILAGIFGCDPLEMASPDFYFHVDVQVHSGVGVRPVA